VPEERIREKSPGLAALYNDWRVFNILHPEQKRYRDLFKNLADYWYAYPNGENVHHARELIRAWVNTLVREYAGKKVLAVSHHLTILAIRAQLERLGPEEFVALDRNEKPINCGVTIYRGDPDQGEDGRLVLAKYNEKLYD
jgi:broad specificity phosphatase PhoE